MRKKQIKKITIVGILAALSVIFYIFLKFPLPFIFPSFLDIQLSNLPVILAGLIFGPAEACIIVVVRFAVKLPMTSTAGIGEIADLVIGLAVALSVSLIYQKMRTKKGGIISLIVTSIIWVTCAILMNTLVLLPWYVEAYGFEAVFGMLKIIRNITPDNYMLYYVLFAVIPFNALLATTVSLITFFVYKRISGLYKDEFDCENADRVVTNALYTGFSLIVIDLVLYGGYLLQAFKKFNLNKFITTTSIFVVVLAFSIGLIVYSKKKALKACNLENHYFEENE